MTALQQVESLAALGQYLREIRESRQTALERVAGDLNIRKAYLEALEEGKWDRLPGTAYGRGYLRQYAGYLGVAVEAVMDTLDRLQGKVQTDLRYFEPVRREQTPSRALLIASLVVIVLGAMAWILAPHEEEIVVAQDYAMPEPLAARLSEPAEPRRLHEIPECLKLLQSSSVICYYQNLEPEPVILANRNWLSVEQIRYE